MSSEPKVPRWFNTGSGGLYVLALVQIAVGFWLSRSYSPTLDGAARSVAELRSGGLGMFLVRFHYWGSVLTLVAGGAMVAWLLLAGHVRRASARRYWGLLALVGLTFGMQVTGNLLPMDAHDVQTTVVEAGIASRVPVVGSAASQAMLGGEAFGQATLSRWVLAHTWLLAVPLLALAALGAIRVVRIAGVGWSALAGLVPPVALAALVGGPTGRPATLADYGAFDASPSFYVLPLHGLLKALDSLSPSLGWIGIAVIPTLLAITLVAAPWHAERSPRSFRVLVISFGCTLGALGLLGSDAAAPVSGSQDPTSLAADLSVVTAIDPALVERGRALFGKVGCSNCHTVDTYKGKGGPNLGSVYQRHPSQGFYVQFIANPSSVKPKSPMPAFGFLPEADRQALGDYLRSPR